MSEESANKRVAKNTAYLYVRMIVVLAVTLYTSRVILQEIGASDYGIYNVVGGVVTMMVFLNSALGASTSRFLTYELGKKDHKKLCDTFSASLNLHIGVALLVLLLGETIGLWFFYEKLVIPDDRVNAALLVYQFSIITTMIHFTQVPYSATLIAHENMSIYAYVGLYEAIVNLVIVYVVSISSFDKLIFYALLLMLNQVSIQFFYRFYTIRRYDESRFRLIKDDKLYKTLLSYSGWDLFGGIAVVSQGQGINILLNLFFGPVVNAARALSVQVRNGVDRFVSNFLMAVRPQVVKYYAEGNTDEMYNLSFNAAKYAYSLMLLFVVPLCFEVHTVLSIWLSDNFPDDTALFVVISLITCQMETYHAASLMPYHAIGKIKLGNVVGGTIMILALPVSYVILKLGAPAYSVFIVIFATNLTQLFWGWMVIHRYVPYSYISLIKKVFIPTIALTIISVVAPTLMVRLMQPGWGRLILLTVITDTIIVTSVYFILLNNAERQKAIMFIKNKISRK